MKVFITKIERSPRKNKRFRVILSNEKKYDFGLLGGSTYIDHKDINKRKNYISRHLGNDTESYLIENLIPSPSLFSMYLLWGFSTDIDENINYLNTLLKTKN